jgi:hypothetical protein
MNRRSFFLVALLSLVLTSCIPGLREAVTNPPPPTACVDPSALVVFPDPDVQGAVLTALKKTAPEELTCQTVFRLKRLTLTGPVTTLEGLDEALSLATLDFSDAGLDPKPAQRTHEPRPV